MISFSNTSSDRRRLRLRCERNSLRSECFRRTLFLFPFIFFLFSSPARAQQPEAIARLDTSVLRIGEQTFLRIGVSYRLGNKAVSVAWPELKDTVVRFVDILDLGKIDTILRDSGSLVYELVRSILITSYDSGFYAIPPFVFLVNDDTVRSEALLLQVNTVPVDTSKAIADIKAPLAVPPAPETNEWIWWAAGALILLLFAGLLVFFLTRKKEVIVAPPPPPEPLHLVTLRKLDEIAAHRYWEGGQYKAYHSAVADTLREYIEKRFRVPALEQTSDEILRSFRNLAADEPSVLRLRQVLILADMVKFAKEIPMSHENELSMENAIAFVKGTTPAYILYGQQPGMPQPPPPPGNNAFPPQP